MTASISIIKPNKIKLETISYRPITLVLENKRLTWRLESGNPLGNNQFNFHSCHDRFDTNLMSTRDSK